MEEILNLIICYLFLLLVICCNENSIDKSDKNSNVSKIEKAIKNDCHFNITMNSPEDWTWSTHENSNPIKIFPVELTSKIYPDIKIKFSKSSIKKDGKKECYLSTEGRVSDLYQISTKTICNEDINITDETFSLSKAGGIFIQCLFGKFPNINLKSNFSLEYNKITQEIRGYLDKNNYSSKESSDTFQKIEIPSEKISETFRRMAEEDYSSKLWEMKSFSSKIKKPLSIYFESKITKTVIAHSIHSNFPIDRKNTDLSLRGYFLNNCRINIKSLKEYNIKVLRKDKPYNIKLLSSCDLKEYRDYSSSYP